MTAELSIETTGSASDEPEPDSRITPDAPPPPPETPSPDPPASTMPVPPPPAAPGGRVTSHKVSASGVTLIKEFEGLPHGGRPYRDMVGVWTIGYGHTEGVGPNSRPLTPAQAADLLRHDLDERYGPPVNALRLPIGQHQFDALVSFVYNCGPGAVGSGTQVGRCLRAGQWSAAADALLAWNKAGGVAVAGLTRRRVAERALFLSEDDPMQDYTDNERRWIHEYDQLVRQGKDRPRRAALRRAMTEQRTTIWHSAQAKGDGGDGRGWEYHARRARYASLLARTS